MQRWNVRVVAWASNAGCNARRSIHLSHGRSSLLDGPKHFHLQMGLIPGRSQSQFPHQQLAQRRTLSFWGEFQKNLKDEWRKTKENDGTAKLLEEQTKKVAEGLSKVTETSSRLTQYVRSISSDVGGKIVEGAGKLSNEVGKAKDVVTAAVNKTIEDQKILKSAKEAAVHTTDAAKTVLKTGADVGSKVAMKAAENISKNVENISQNLSQTKAVQTAYDFIEQEKQKELENNKPISESKETGIVIRQETAWDKWQNKILNNSIIKSLTGIREKMEESDSVILQKALDVQDSVTVLVGKALKTPVSEVLRKARNLDPNFDTLKLQENLQNSLIRMLFEATEKKDFKTLKEICLPGYLEFLQHEFANPELAGIKSKSMMIDFAHDVEFQNAVFDKKDKSPAVVYSYTIIHIQHYVKPSGTEEVTVMGGVDQIMHTSYICVLGFDSSSKHWKFREVHALRSINAWG